MKKLLILLLLLFVSTLCSATPINIVVPVAPGGAIDAFSRTLSKILSDNGIENIVLNQPGANGDIAYRHVINEKDNVILTGAIATFVFSNVVANRDNIFVDTMQVYGPVISSPTAFMSNPNGFKTFNEMIAYAKKTPLPCGATNAHGQSEMNRINKTYGTKFESVMYKGGGPVAQDLGGDNLRCAYDGVGSHIQRHNANMLRILATADPTVVKVPLISSALPGYKFSNWYGFALPNNSNLLDNPKVMNILKNITTYKEQLDVLTGDGKFIVEKPYTNMPAYLLKETRTYRDLAQ